MFDSHHRSSEVIRVAGDYVAGEVVEVYTGTKSSQGRWTLARVLCVDDVFVVVEYAEGSARGAGGRFSADYVRLSVHGRIMAAVKRRQRARGE